MYMLEGGGEGWPGYSAKDVLPNQSEHFLCMHVHLSFPIYIYIYIYDL